MKVRRGVVVLPHEGCTPGMRCFPAIVCVLILLIPHLSCAVLTPLYGSPEAHVRLGERARVGNVPMEVAQLT